MTPLFDLSQDRSSETPLDQDSARAALDELFTLAGKYNSSDAYLELMRFVGRFRFYSPVQCNVDLHANAGCVLRLHCSQVAEGLPSRDQNRRPADCDPATDGARIICVRCK